MSQHEEEISNPFHPTLYFSVSYSIRPDSGVFWIRILPYLQSFMIQSTVLFRTEFEEGTIARPEFLERVKAAMRLVEQVSLYLPPPSPPPPLTPSFPSLTPLWSRSAIQVITPRGAKPCRLLYIWNILLTFYSFQHCMCAYIR